MEGSGIFNRFFNGTRKPSTHCMEYKSIATLQNKLHIFEKLVDVNKETQLL